MALGSGRRTIIWMVLRDVCVVAAAGLAISVPIVLATSRLVESFLFQVEPNDPTTLAAAFGVLMTATLFASYGPARRASRISPTAALRQD